MGVAHHTRPAARAFSAFRSATRSPFWLLCADLYPVFVAASLPWSTTAVAVFSLIWLIVLTPTIDPRAFLRSMTLPAYWLPVAFFALGMIALFWADGPWAARIQGLHPLAKLLMIPLLLYHFERSKRGHWVFVAFLVSCVLLMVLSSILFLAPEWQNLARSEVAGIPVRNSISQSQELALCIFALMPFVLTLFKQRRFALAVVGTALIIAFFANLTFVALARTALIYIPILTLLFALKYLGYRASGALIAGGIATIVVVWFASPYLRYRVESVAADYREYKESHGASSMGRRLEWWAKSIDFISEAPLIGSGTGSTKQLLNRDAAGKSGDWAKLIGNPHNQTLHVAIQWGFLGCVILYAMWWSHMLLFTGVGYAAWIGLIVVAQNFVSSLFNSHLFDFAEGWIYVLGVGVAGGMSRRPDEISESETTWREGGTG
jgi:O-antigen ligase